ncbi:hypothetical protein PLUTO_00330 [Luteibacter phage vB_LflM-Pluto]|uniref:Uncharacterized protein n=1 Tax=Luteibacter phage vB_LflM-Pluto TaxID=2948611 RepID=A0A9E7MTQ7_9CAUD|nr:hypothetical protein PLUTO_00330 [Luteibacter phage vB_LflM-Pluto]
MNDEVQKVDVLAGIRLAARDCGAQGNHAAELELLGIAVAVRGLIEASNLLLAGSVAQAVAADHPDMPKADKENAAFRASDARDAVRRALARVGG